jgi:formate hydrogenlyase subunit 6/NADH:ubiquinone oxidoreductase subunit I
VIERILYKAEAGWLRQAVVSLRAAGVQVVAPTLTEPGVVNFAPVASADQIERKYANVVVPLKKYFQPISEVLLEFEMVPGGDITVRPEPLPPPDKTVIIGCRPCDAAAVGILDKVFQWDWDDLRYRARRERTTLVSFACTDPEPTCFCTSVGGSPHGRLQSDVLVFDSDTGGALVEVHTPKGEEFAKLLGEVIRPASDGLHPQEAVGPPARFNPAKVKQWLDNNFANEFLTKRSLACLGCGACTFLCPTCHCFDIVDEAVWNRGQRRRNWDSCSFALFTLHASGHNPRPDQFARFRQRIMHKFAYFPDRFGLAACVGCGRCVKACGVGRNLTDTLAAMESL